MKRREVRNPVPVQIWRYQSKRRHPVRRSVSGGKGEPPAHSSSAYSLRDLLTVLFKQKRVILAFFVTTMVVVTVGLLVKPPTFEASAAILVKRNRAEVPLSATQTDAVLVSVSEEDLNSEVEILRSRSLVEGALRRLTDLTVEGPNLLARVRGVAKRVLGRPILTPFEAQTLELQKRLRFGLIPRSNIIQISYQSPDPQWAADVVGALIEEYLTYRVQVYQFDQAAQFFDVQTESAGRQLKDAEDALQEYTRGSGVAVSHEEQRQLALRKLDEFERALADAYVEVQRDRNQVAALQERIDSIPERLPTAYRMNQDPETEQISSSLVELRMERDGLLTRGYSETNVRVRDLDAQIQLAEERLSDAEQRAGDINRTEINEVHQTLKGELLTAQASLAGATASYEALRVQVESFRDEANNLTEKSFDLTRLIREANAAEQAYLLYRQKRDEAQVSQAMDQQNMANVSIAREPRRPLAPIGFSTVGLFVSAIVLTSVGSVGVGFAREFLDHSFTTGEDLERALDIPHLASVPLGPALGVSGGAEVALREEST